jgi:hypothetical protein
MLTSGMLTSRGRARAWPGLILLLAVCLVADIATPLLPGAFRFDPDESVDAVRARTMPALTLAALPAVFVSGPPPAVRPAAPRVLRAPRRGPIIRPVRVFGTDAGVSSESPEDH